jgi:hypothetical protein
MLDTVILQIPIDYSAIIDHSKFKPSTKDILNNPEGFSKYVNNPTKEDKEKGIYKPRLTAIKRGGKIDLKAEFSVPKLLFGNNLEEAEENNFDEVVNKLRDTIKEMGVILWSHQIENAEVSVFHPSKNIPLSKGYTSSFAIRELSKINLNQKLDLEKVSFRNNGESLQLYANRHSIVLYDKINDLDKPQRRAIDKNQTKLQLDLFKHIEKEKKDLEVLRFEIRLSHKDKMKEVLEKVNYTGNLAFKSVFKKDLCQKIVKLYWEEFFSKDLFLFSVNNNPQKILQQILMKYPKTNIRTAIMLIGLNLLCKDEEGIRGFRSIAKDYKPKTNWEILKRYLDKFNNSILEKPAHGFIKDIQQNINEFKAFKLNKER